MKLWCGELRRRGPSQVGEERATAAGGTPPRSGANAAALTDQVRPTQPVGLDELRIENVRRIGGRSMASAMSCRCGEAPSKSRARVRRP